MNIKPGLVCLFLLLVFNNHASAVCVSAYCSSKIEQIMITATQTRIVPEESVSEISNLNCTVLDDKFLILPNLTNGNDERMYSAILAAQKAGHKIMLRIEDNSNPCEISYIRVYDN